MRNLYNNIISVGLLILILFIFSMSHSAPVEEPVTLPTVVINIPTATPNITTHPDTNTLRLNTITGLKPPYEYPSNSCEIIAKDVQKEHGGDLIFIQPLTDSGAWDLCSTCGHWINLVYKKEIGMFYVDYGNGVTFLNETEVIKFYRNVYNHNVEIFDVNKQSPPFGLMYR